MQVRFSLSNPLKRLLKAFSIQRGYRAIITHSVTELLEESSKLKRIFGDLINYGKELDRHYISSRHPNFYPKGPAYKYYTREMAEKCLNYVELILKEVRKFFRR
ncbi:MAG: HEPN domain-containing protein [Candidatus Bathyarchaeia archaeon]